MFESPDTSLTKKIRAGSPVRLWFAAPGAVSVTGPLLDYPWLDMVPQRGLAPGEGLSLTEAFPPQAVASSPSRDRLTLSSAFAGQPATLTWGDAFVWSPLAGCLPVRVASVSGTDVRLVEAMQYPLPTAEGTTLLPALWYADLANEQLLDEVTRVTEGDFPVLLTVTWSLRGANGTKVESVQRGELSVVKQPFETDLTTGSLRSLYPELGGLAQVGEAGLAAAVKRSHMALSLRVGSDVLESGAPGATWEDDISATHFLASHAAYAAAEVVQSISPDRAVAYREQGDALYRAALSKAWFDRNRSGTVDAGESPGLLGMATARRQAPSRVGNGCVRWQKGQPR